MRASRHLLRCEFNWRAAAVIVGLSFLSIPPSLAQVPGRCETPASQRTGEIGCYVSADVNIGELPAEPLYWHIYQYPTEAAAKAASNDAQKTTVIEAHGEVLLYAIGGEAWRPVGGEHLASLGPIAAKPGSRYIAHFIEAVFPPGMKTNVHFHYGYEATFVLAGQECVETPNGKIVNTAGQGAVVAENTPMQLLNPGPEMRRAVALILHDSTQNWATPTQDWTPKGLCAQ